MKHPYNKEQRSKFSSFGAMSLKEACTRKPVDKLPHKQVNYLNFLDTMQESINKNVQDNVFPHWRNHQSLKGTVSPPIQPSLH